MPAIRKKKATKKQASATGAKSIARTGRSKLHRMLRKGARSVTTSEVEKDKPVITSQVLPDLPVEAVHGEVGVSYGLTIGLSRKFEFARIDVSVRVPYSGDGRESAYENARDWAQAKIRAEVDAVREAEAKAAEERARAEDEALAKAREKPKALKEATAAAEKVSNSKRAPKKVPDADTSAETKSAELVEPSV